MSEYWISQKKYYCNVCQCYMADNKMSRQLHENGNKHKEKVEEMLKKKRESKFHGARSEKELRLQLAEIEKAARTAVAEDRLSASQTSSGGNLFGLNDPGAPPPPPSLNKYPSSGRFEQRQFSRPEPKGDELNETEDNRGIYTVDGQTYLEGKRFEHKIYGGTSCQVFDEAADEWMDGEVTTRVETPIPNTDMYLLSFNVTYRRSTPEDGVDLPQQDDVIVEKGVKSDRIRLLGTPDGELLLPAMHPNLPPPKPKIDENTGVGQWQTVSVTVLDETEENDRKQQSQIDVILAEERAEKDQPIKGKHPEDETQYADSALSAYDPYNTKMYKGVRLHDIVVSNAEIAPLCDDGEVIQFRKRKKVDINRSEQEGKTSGAPSKGALNARKPRRKDADEI